MKKLTVALLLILTLALLAQAGLGLAEMRARGLCLSAGFGDARLAWGEVYCVTVKDGTEWVAPIVDGRIYIVVPGDGSPPMEKKEI